MLPHKLLAAEDFRDPAEVKADLLCDVAHRQAVFLRPLEALTLGCARFGAFTLCSLLGALELGLSASHLGSCLSLWLARH